jgi:hypothetical protein
MSSHHAWQVGIAFVGAALACADFAVAGAVPVSRDSQVRAAVVNDQVNLVDVKQTSTFDNFSATAQVFDDEHASGNAVADQTSKLTLVNGLLRAVELHGTATAGGGDAEASGRFHLIFDVAPGQLFFLDTAGDGGGGGQSTVGIVELLLVERTGPGKTLLHRTSGENPVSFDARSLVAPGDYELTVTYEANGFSGAQIDLMGRFTNAIPLPPAVWSGAATMAAVLASWRWVRRSAVGERRRRA